MVQPVLAIFGCGCSGTPAANPKYTGAVGTVCFLWHFPFPFGTSPDASGEHPALRSSDFPPRIPVPGAMAGPPTERLPDILCYNTRSIPWFYPDYDSFYVFKYSLIKNNILSNGIKFKVCQMLRGIFASIPMFARRSASRLSSRRMCLNSIATGIDRVSS
jgi:hypothetical protein